MNIRKTRTHHTGASNLAVRTETSHIEDQPHIPHYAVDTSKAAKRIGDIILKRSLTPTRKTREFYETHGKDLKFKPELSIPRSSQLEEKEKRKMVFTGESPLAYDKNFKKYREQVSTEHSPRTISKMEKESLIKDKRQAHGTAIQETQLVGYDKYSAETLKNNVNLEKVREAKRILRRRYANRVQLQRVYSAWDQEGKGHVSLDNMYNMSKRLGLNLNVDEARVLLASANKNGSGQLVLDEFLDLIFNKDDTLNVDLDSLSKGLDANYILKREELYKEGNDGVIKKLENNAQKMRDNKRMNQVTLVLKNKLNQIAANFVAADPNKLGYVNYERFEENIMKLGVNESIITLKDVKNIASKFKHSDHHTIDYKSFLDSLKDYEFKFEDMYTEYKPSPKKKSESLGPIRTDASEPEFNIVDCRDIPFNSMMGYLQKRSKVNRAIKRFFPTKEDFKDYLSKSLSVSKDQVENKPISKTGLQNVITSLFSNFDDNALRKRDLEGFVSSFLYNKHGYTNLQDLCHGIYEGNASEYFDNITYKKAGVPPHAAISGANERLSVPTEPSEALLTSSTPNGKVHRGFSHSPSKTNKSLAIYTESDKELREILQKVDNSVFVGTRKSFDIYKEFDLDKDGYVSHKDFTTKIQEMAILKKEDIPKLVDYLDPEHKGYVNYKDFNNKIRTNMTNIINHDEYGQSTTLPSVSPSKKFNHKETPFMSDYKRKIQEVTKGFDYSYTVIPDQTRFGASPQWTNTFLNFQPPSNTGMFISEAQRFDRDHLHRTKFQKEEQAKRTSASLGRIEAIQNYREQIQKKIEFDLTKQDSRFENTLKRRGMDSSLFERRAKLKNAFAF